MSVVRDVLWLVIENGNEVRTMTSSRPADVKRRAGVHVRSEPDAAMRHALALAGGDITRLRCDEDGSVYVSNVSRRAESPLRSPGRAYGSAWA